MSTTHKKSFPSLVESRRKRNGFVNHPGRNIKRPLLRGLFTI